MGNVKNKKELLLCHSGMLLAGIQGKLRFEYNRK
jgi:hypothetical protein